MGYGVLILSKFPFDCYEIQFESNMGRSLLLAEILINDRTFVCANIHLESLSNELYRKTQLKCSFDILDRV